MHISSNNKFLIHLYLFLNVYNIFIVKIYNTKILLLKIFNLINKDKLYWKIGHFKYIIIITIKIKILTKEHKIKILLHSEI